jgi:aarF domain-containing kinase
MLSGDFIPPQYMEWMKQMQDEVPTQFAPGQAKQIIIESLAKDGKKFGEIFATFEDEPCGCASIGQCHKATLKDGSVVAIKVMMPGIERQFRSDLKTMKAFCTLAMPQHVSPLDEIEKQFLTEFDYKLEAKNLRLVHDNIMPKWGDQVKIPRAYEELCTPEVLVMEFLPGIKLVDGVRNQWRAYAARNNTTLEALEEEHKEKMRRGEVELKTLEESEREAKLQAAAVKSLNVFENAKAFLYNWTVGFVAPTIAAQVTEVPLNLGKILRLCADVHAHEIFVDGAFNGDPHPGNILLMPDGRLGLIDYGQVRHNGHDTMMRADWPIACLLGRTDRKTDPPINVGNQAPTPTRPSARPLTHPSR